MNQKPKIQYIGQFYVYGSEARELAQQNQPRKPKTTLPMAKLEKLQNVYVDPVAMIAIAVSLIMLVTMVAGVQQLQADWAEYRMMSDWIHELKEEHHVKSEQLQEAYDLSDVRAKATAMGMIPKTDAEHIVLHVTLPEPEPVATFWDNVIWFVTGLFA